MAGGSQPCRSLMAAIRIYLKIMLRDRVPCT
jgi:hypothetical protein